MFGRVKPFGLVAAALCFVGVAAAAPQTVRRGGRSLVVYALYNAPKVTVSFRATVPSSSALLQSGVSSFDANEEFGDVLKSVTEGFLLDAFRQRVDQLSVEEEHGAFYANLQTIDLETAELYIDNGISAGGDESDNTRRLADHQVAVTVRYDATLAFREPSSKANKPTNEIVAWRFGMWMDDAFSADRDVYLKALLQQYESDVLRQTTHLKVTVEEANKDPVSATGANANQTSDDGSNARSVWIIILMVMLGMIISGSLVGFALHMRHQKRGPWWDSRSYVLDYDESDAGMSQVDFSTVNESPANSGARSVLQASDVYLSKHRPDLFQAVHGSAAQFFPTSSTKDPVTGQSRRTSLFSRYLYGEDEQSAASPTEGGHDYKAREGPPVRNVLGRVNSEGEVSSVTSGGLSAFRNYVMPSNPFEYIYGGGKFQAKEEPQNTGPARPARLSRRSSSFTPRGDTDDFSFQRQQSTRNFAAAGAVDDVIESKPSYGGSDHYDENDPVPHSWPTRPIASIWRNISNMWDGQSQPTVEDESVLYSNDGIQYRGSEDLDEDEHGIVFGPILTHHQYYPNGIEETEEPEKDLPFAFRDFPRHDGTPCLIFDEQEKIGNNGNGMFVITDDDGEMEDVPITPRDAFASTQPMSNRAFQKMLSQHSFKSMGSIEDSALMDDDDSIIDSDDEEDSGSAEKTRRNKEFLAKLDRVMAQRHRQYEKRAIVEKHREARARERAEKREKERRERHNAMERGIDELESTLLSPLPPPQKSVYQTSPLKNFSSSPSHHRRNSSSSIRSMSPNTSGPATIIPARHKGMPDLKLNTHFSQSRFTSTENPLETLVMPPMGPKYPSPTSVMDNALGQPPVASSSYMRENLPAPVSPNPNHRHRRVHSFGNDEKKMDESSHGGPCTSHSMHRRVYSGHSIPLSGASGHRRTPSTGHNRTNSTGHNRTNSNSSHHRRNNTSEDLMVHGIYAKTRFV